jgi:hypothetical protein
MPSVGGSASATARSLRYAQTFGLNIPTPLLRHSLQALAAYLRYDAAQSLYPGRQTIIESQVHGRPGRYLPKQTIRLPIPVLYILHDM